MSLKRGLCGIRCEARIRAEALLRGNKQQKGCGKWGNYGF